MFMEERTALTDDDSAPYEYDNIVIKVGSFTR
jgi:hypothetical protein